MSNDKQGMKLYTEEQLKKYIFDEGFIEIIDFENNSIPPIELPSDDKLYLMAEKHAEKCGLRNFFDEDEVTIIKHHWVKGYESAIKDFLNTQVQVGNNEQQ